MKATIISATFETHVQSTGSRFSVPKAVCVLLGVDDGLEHDLDLVVRDGLGKPLYGGTKRLKSDKEIYGADLEKLQPNQRIRVEASLP